MTTKCIRPRTETACTRMGQRGVFFFETVERKSNYNFCFTFYLDFFGFFFSNLLKKNYAAAAVAASWVTQKYRKKKIRKRGRHCLYRHITTDSEKMKRKYQYLP